jgi:hypothetical protein
MSIDKMKQGRIDAVLNRRLQYNGKIMTRREWVEMRHKEGVQAEIGSKPRVMFDRHKFNRMTNHKEQMEYERKTEERVPEYRIYHPVEKGVYNEVTKTEYDYFISLNK